MAKSNKAELGRGRFRQAALLKFLRGQVAGELRREEGLTFFEAREEAREVADDMYAEACERVRLDQPTKTGSLLDFINNIDIEKLKAIIAIIMTLIGLFKASPERLAAFAAVLEKCDTVD